MSWWIHVFFFALGCLFQYQCFTNPFINYLSFHMHVYKVKKTQRTLLSVEKKKDHFTQYSNLLDTLKDHLRTCKVGACDEDFLEDTQLGVRSFTFLDMLMITWIIVYSGYRLCIWLINPNCPREKKPQVKGNEGLMKDFLRNLDSYSYLTKFSLSWQVFLPQHVETSKIKKGFNQPPKKQVSAVHVSVLHSPCFSHYMSLHSLKLKVIIYLKIGRASKKKNIVQSSIFRSVCCWF